MHGRELRWLGVGSDWLHVDRHFPPPIVVEILEEIAGCYAQKPRYCSFQFNSRFIPCSSPFRALFFSEILVFLAHESTQGITTERYLTDYLSY
jgi:hypothetical protein